MNHHIKLLIVFVLITFQSFAGIVPENIARTVAKNFFNAQYSSLKGIEIKNLSIDNTIITSYHNQVVYYIFNFKDYGFVQVAADDAAYPILAYNLSKQINNETSAANYNAWMEMYKKQIEAIRIQKLEPSSEIYTLWNQLKNNQSSKIVGGKSIDPLLLSTWNQGSLYNAQCPEDVDGPGGRVYAGCVAIAMAQIMYYYRYPQQGVGSYSYYHYTYGNQSANFGGTNYQWNSMTNQMPQGGNHEIAQLLYQLGVSVDMDYSASGSGAYSGTAAASLRSYFKYQSSLSLKHKSNYSYSQWVSMITSSIDAGIPLYYHGYGATGGHAFNLDGYQGSDHFHFNWGWGGSYDGYFYLNALNPGTSNFNNGQGAIFDIYPSNSYPYSCGTNNQLTEEIGTLTDGSGPNTYDNNLQCSWLIQPNILIDYIKLSFDRFDLANDDTLFIYDGNSNNDSLLAALTGGQIPSNINSTGGKVFIELITNSALKAQGFAISYKSYLPIYCSGTALYTDSTASFKDGSDTNNYNNSTICKCFIDPSNGYPIRLFFDSFDTEYGNDYVKIYDPMPTPSVLLASYSGQSIPPSVVSPSGKMMVIFTSNTSTNYLGWEAHYITGPSVGIKDSESKSNYKVYPNPAKDIIYIQPMDNNSNNPIQVILFNSNGKSIKELELNSNQSGISLSTKEFNNGIYYLRIIDNKSTITKKIAIIN